MAVWGGFTFVSLHPDQTPPLAEQLGAERRGHGQLPAGRPPAGRSADLRGGRQLEGHRRELQRVLPLRSRPPGAVRAGAGLPARGRRRPGVGRRHPPPRRRLDLHQQRHQRPGAVPRPQRRGAGPAQGGARLPEPAAQPLGRPRRRVHAPAPGARPHHRRVRLPVRAGGDRRARLRPDRRGRLLGPRQPPGLAHRRERAAGHGLLRGRAGLVRADGGRLGRHRSLVPPRHGRRHRGCRGPTRRPGRGGRAVAERPTAAPRRRRGRHRSGRRGQRGRLLRRPPRSAGARAWSASPSAVTSTARRTTTAASSAAATTPSTTSA